MPSESEVLNSDNLDKLRLLKNQYALTLVEKYVDLCKPRKATVITDSPHDISYVRDLSLRNEEEAPLTLPGHTIHYDGFFDQGRDREVTAVLLPPGEKMSKRIRTLDRESGLKEVLGLLNGAMIGKEMLVRFFCLGPTNSRFSVSALQITDSAYVGHSEDLLYRTGYEQFKRLGGSPDFFVFVHSAGELDERKCSKNVAKKRIYIDVTDGKVYSINTQYAGNSLGLKKLALRLAVYKAHHSDWLSEHMLIMGVHPEGKNRVSYFTGAYPSACGKTSTAMIPGQTIVGDDICYLKIDEEGLPRAVNIESGVFGIIQDVNPVDDPLIYRALTTPRELIFSNVLVADGTPYWLGMGRNDVPSTGLNYSGEWWDGKKDAEGNRLPYAHPNARYTMRISELENADPKINDPNGVAVQGILYGGRDSDTNVPICEALNWEHGVYIGATIESETTTATIGKTGVRNSDPWAIMDFMVVPLGTYLRNHLEFGRRLKKTPRVFATNYFLKHDGKYTNEKVDKKVWLLWAEGRVHNEYEALITPIGYLPRYSDLRSLFGKTFQRDYSESDYNLQFSLRLDHLLARVSRMEDMYRQEEGMPKEFWDVLNRQKKALGGLREKEGRSELPPSYFSK